MTWHEGRYCECTVNFTAMNSFNALGFLVLGIVMHVAPTLAPHFSGAASDPSSRSALWLWFMSYVVGGIGSLYFVHQGYHVSTAYLAKVQLPSLLRPATAKRPAPDLATGVRVTS